ncbi:MAG: hypothetical protein IT373_22540, partial [Polyangiaceae bacterium]|nr:hypothetical protein [Polyangiaceae bacterium]
AVRGKAAILHAISAPPGTRFFGHRKGHGWVALNMQAAGQFHFAEAVPALRRELERPFASAEVDYRLFDELEPKMAAAVALVDLGDTASAPALAALLASIETRPQSQWEDGVRALERLDPRAAQRYALEVLGRVTAESRAPAAGDIAAFDVRAENAISAVLPSLVEPSPAALAALDELWLARGGERGLEHDRSQHQTCKLLAARLRLGDTALRQALAPELATDLRTSRGVNCYSELIDLVFPGDDPAEVATLTFRHRYGGILRIAAAVRAAARAGRPDARLEAAGDELRRWLVAEDGTPGIAGGTSDTRYRWHEHGAHLVAKILLGDEAARRELVRRATEGGGDEAVAWDGVWHALRYDLAGAADLGAAMLEGLIDRAHARRFDVDYHHNDGSPEKVVLELARRGDARFALGLLAERFEPREAAVRALGRLRPAAACDIVAGGALRAQLPYDHQAVERAFWALSVLGDACRPTAARLARAADSPEDVRGMALELGAMVRDPGVQAYLDALGGEAPGGTGPFGTWPAEPSSWLRASLRRARLIHGDPQ